MEAIIKSIKLKNVFNRYFFVIELQDINGITYYVDKPFLSDSINFRKQVFGIMAACNQFDLLKLGSNTPLYKDVVGYYSNGLKILENDQDKWFTYDSRTSRYFCECSDNKIKELFKVVSERDVFDTFVKKGKIESIKSQSGVFQIFFKSDSVSAFMNTGQIYYGFGYPINIGDSSNLNDIKRSSENFQSFIVNIMKFYGIDDLLMFSGKADINPLVDIVISKNKVVNITSLETGMGISIGKNYDIINVFKPSFQKKQNK